MIVRARLAHFARDRSGVAAVELAFAMPVLLAMILGTIWAGMLGLAATSLNAAAQSAARCASVNATLCATPSAVLTYAAARYTGPAIGAAFNYSASGCGHVVTGQGTFSMRVIPGIPDVPLAATACYP